MTLNPKPKTQLAISLRLKMKLPRMPLGMPNPSVTAAKPWGEQGSHMAFKDAYGGFRILELQDFAFQSPGVKEFAETLNPILWRFRVVEGLGTLAFGPAVSGLGFRGLLFRGLGLGLII